MSATWNAVDLLNLGDEGRTKPYINQYWAQTLGVIFGVGTGVFINFGTRRPSFSGNYIITITNFYNIPIMA